MYLCYCSDLNYFRIILEPIKNNFASKRLILNILGTFRVLWAPKHCWGPNILRLIRIRMDRIDLAPDRDPQKSKMLVRGLLLQPIRIQNTTIYMWIYMLTWSLILSSV